MVVCGRHHLWQPCLNLAHTPHRRLIDGQGLRPVRRPITAIHRLAGGTKAFEIPLGFRCEPVKHALVDITHLLSTESQELAKTAHACAQAKGACPHTRRGGGRVGGRDGTERPATSLPAGLLPPAAPHIARGRCSRTSGHNVPLIPTHHQPLRWQRRHLRLFCQRRCAKRPAAPRRGSPLSVLDLCPEVALVPALAARLSSLRCGQPVCSGRRCTAPPCASRGGRAAREGAVPRAICVSCHGARVGESAHWSIGTWRRSGARAKARAWAVITVRAREPRAPGRLPHTRAPLQTAQQPHGATFCHTPSVRRWPGASPQRGGRPVARPAVPASRKHPVVIGGGCAARERRWKGPKPDAVALSASLSHRRGR